MAALAILQTDSLATTEADKPVTRTLLAWLESHSPLTQRSYGKTAGRFIQDIGGLASLKSVTPSAITAWLAKLKPTRGSSGQGRATEKISASTTNQRLAILKSLFRALATEGITGNPAAFIKSKQATHKHHTALSVHRTLEGLAAIEKVNDPVLRARNKAIALLLLNNALRRSEISAIQIKGVKDGEIEIVGKGGKPARIILNKPTKAALEEWLRLRSSTSGALFVNFWHKRQGDAVTPVSIRKMTQKYFGCNPHQLRARSITDLWERSGHNIGHAQAHARHSSPAITERIYVQGRKVEEAARYQPDYS